jgi:CDP-diacylglycerol--glycerol-3-phosphate 3-phosphatidyltransferase
MGRRQLPNLLSASRIPGALLLLVLYRPDSPTRAVLSIGLILLIIGTDLLDGKMARRFGVASEFGYLLDGLGDRAVHVAAYLLLVTAHIIPLLIAWVLIFREICQYGVRIVDPAWHATQSKSDRRITRFYTAIIHSALLVVLGGEVITLEPPAYAEVLAINLILCAGAIATYSRILPRLVRAWREAASG